MLINFDYLLITVLYVDDPLITGRSFSIIVAVKTSLHDMFSMIDMSLVHYFLGLEINQVDSRIKMSHSNYARDLLVRFHMADCKPTTTPFLFKVNLEDGRDTPLVDCTKYVS
jgi:hypothetical protein